MALSKHGKKCGRDFYVNLASLINFKTAPVSSFPHAALSWDFEQNVVEGLLLEAAHLVEEPSKKQAFWLAKVVDRKGYLICLRFLGAEADSIKDFWRNFAAYKEPVAGQLDERVYPVGWAKENGQPFEPPQEIKDCRQDWDSFLEKQVQASGTVLRENFHDIVREENECDFKVDMTVEVTDINEMKALRPAIVEEVIGLRIKFRYLNDKGAEQHCWFHEFSEDFRPEGWWSLIGRKLNATPEYKESSARKLTMLGGPHEEDEATIFHFKPLLIPEFLLARLRRYQFKTGFQLEVIDPLKPGISVGTIVEVLENNYLIVEIKHELDRNPKNHKKYQICVHAASESLLPPGFAVENELTAYFNPPRANFRYVKSTKVPRKLLQRLMPRHDFKAGQMLELVGVSGSDQIYVGTIKRIVAHVLLIHFEGWSHKHNHFFPMTSPDLFPVGYCDMIGHRLVTPDLRPNLKQNLKPITRLPGVFITRKDP